MTPKDPEQTRKSILDAAMEEMYLHGFQAASLDRILKGTGVTKGALYHHFPNKKALGYAVVDEVIRGWMLQHWTPTLQETDDPLTAIREVMVGFVSQMSPEQLRQGCPCNNLAQEMSPVDEGFRIRLDAILDEWRGLLSEALERGIRAGTVRADVSASGTAAFLVASIEGMAGMAKTAQSSELAAQMIRGLEQVLEGLRPVAAARSSAV